MIKKNILQAIREKEMDRKDFLKYSGLAIASVVGFKAVVTLFTQDNQKLLANKSQKEATRGFGSGKYGV